MNNWKTAPVFVLGLLTLSMASAVNAQSRAARAANALSGRRLITRSSTMAPLVSEIAKRFSASPRATDIVIAHDFVPYLD